MKQSLSLIIGFSILLIACSPKGYVYNSRKLQKVTITDFGELYSTYDLSSKEKKELKKQLKDQTWVDEIVEYSNEENWPEAIQELDDRLENRPTIKKYNFYKVATIDSKTIVIAPEDKNMHMPYKYRPAGSFYMIFNSDAVKVK
jgi:hypothetical protein